MTFSSIVGIFVKIISGYLVPIIIGCMVLVFLNGLRKFIYEAENPSKHKAGRDLMIYGVVGIVIAVSVWGILSILVETIGAELVIPQLG